MRDNRGIDRDIGSIARKFQEVWDAINGLSNERRAGSTTIGNGGLIVDGGDVVMLDADGSVIFRLGAQTYGDRGITISRDDGSIAMELRKPFGPTSAQMFQIKDGLGNGILAEEFFGNGLASPLLSMPMQPVAATTPDTFGWSCATTSGAFVDLFRWQGSRLNQWYRPVFNVKMSDTVTAGEVQLVNAANVGMAPFLSAPWVGSVPAGSTADQEVKPPGGLEFVAPYNEVQVVRVQARRTAGAGTITVTVKASQGGAA